eukprot:1502294-Alexandrium_andersonii.AAC.1
MYTLFHSGTATNPSYCKASSQRRSQKPPESGCPYSALIRGTTGSHTPRHDSGHSWRGKRTNVLVPFRYA